MKEQVLLNRERERERERESERESERDRERERENSYTLALNKKHTSWATDNNLDSQPLQ